MTRVLFLLLLLVCTAQAQDVFVNNRAFEGVVQGSGSEIYLEIDPLLQMLKLDALPEGLLVKEGDGSRLVHLKSLAEAANLRVIRSAELGTLDVYGPKKGARASAATGAPSGTSTVSNSAPRAQSPSAGTVPGGANSPGEAVKNYFNVMSQTCRRLDFSQPGHFDEFLGVQQPLITQSSFQALSELVTMTKATNNGAMFGQQMKMLFSTRCEVLGSSVNGDEAEVKTRLDNPQMSGDPFETFKCYRVGGKWKVDPGFGD